MLKYIKFQYHSTFEMEDWPKPICPLSFSKVRAIKQARNMKYKVVCYFLFADTNNVMLKAK